MLACLIKDSGKGDSVNPNSLCARSLEMSNWNSGFLAGSELRFPFSTEFTSAASSDMERRCPPVL